jgi:hypothetical protein
MYDSCSRRTVLPLTLYRTFVIASIRTRQRRITDVLNLADEPFPRHRRDDRRIRLARHRLQADLSAVLFAVTDEVIEARPDLRTPKVPEMAMISLPPFRITGRIHLLPERDLHEALSELTGNFIPVTEATYWSDTVGEARATAELLAFNHSRAHILAPHTEVDPWHGLDRSAAAGGAIATSRRRRGGAGAGPWAPPAERAAPTEPPRRLGLGSRRLGARLRMAGIAPCVVWPDSRVQWTSWPTNEHPPRTRPFDSDPRS